MLGLIGQHFQSDSDYIFAFANGDRVNLKPWNVTIQGKESKMNPGGKIEIKAASQDDFKRILKENPDMGQIIGELSEQQIAIVRSLQGKDQLTKTNEPVKP